jgi:2-polyprenyl-3-methyl-5-hydroxy-6-metoxy-1,4-benzoquinol methylase
VAPDTSLFDLPFDDSWGLPERFFLDVEHRYTKSHRLVADVAGDLRGKHILDLGCSRGMLLERFKRYPDAVLTGEELDPAMRAEAVARGIRVDAFQINIFAGEQITARIPYADAAFDVVLAAEIIEHIVDTESFVAEVFRILQPGGIAFFSTPNILWWKYRLDLLRGRCPDPLEHRLHYGTDFGHVRTFTPALLRELVEHAGFEVARVAGKRLGPIATLTKLPRPLARLLDDLATRHPNLADDVFLVAAKPDLPVEALRGLDHRGDGELLVRAGAGPLGEADGEFAVAEQAHDRVR